MIIYTTCRDCGGLLHTTDGDTVHPLCVPKPTKAERLAEEWRNAVEVGDDQHAEQLQTQIDELDARPPRLLDAALRYATWGWPVFPLKPRAKQPATRNGFKDATTDPDRVRRWWERHPDSNIGLPTGHTFDVIDIDVPAGPASFAQLLADDAVPDVHGQVATASGGLHLYIPATGEGNKAGIEPGIDYRGAGGYVVAPPSWLGERGRSWSWITAPSPRLTQPREVAAR
ncbi:bifunctional DNA primase/polymerase [Mycolicibacterium sp. F2034L]|uniref:bifunctional DNA primase/polymerase n=1 Tax=Mycolicibacterium sp. F2034L TaxID=2926422 RepID=UPI001FF45AF1|nr:bifunctional DNA primase/polymerase [Mycolicibacterium sp. F2034L]MCK0174785.1 bifunctional DNA primase/polymerase [Mycolicibacterium sp. F2034L]